VWTGLGWGSLCALLMGVQVRGTHGKFFVGMLPFFEFGFSWILIWGRFAGLIFAFAIAYNGMISRLLGPINFIDLWV